MGYVENPSGILRSTFETEDDIAAYLEAAFEEGDPSLIAAALGDIARAKGMAQIARDTGLRREPFTRPWLEGNPEFATIMKVVSALGLSCIAPQSNPAEICSPMKYLVRSKCWP